jgi:two-component system capsular synthesis sensor histidine kinase RcsC
MFRFPRPSLQQTVPSTTASVLLRCLTVCVFICLAAAAGFYLLTAFTEDISTHRREMNAAAYRAQIYFDQREALLRYLGDSVLAGNPDAPATDSRHAPGGAGWTRRPAGPATALVGTRRAHAAGAADAPAAGRCAGALAAGDAVDVDLARLPSPHCRRATAAWRARTRCTGCARVSVASHWQGRCNIRQHPAWLARCLMPMQRRR